MSVSARLALACLVCFAACSSTDALDPLCQGVICTSGQCKASNGAPACVCSEADRAKQLSCSIATPITAGDSGQGTIATAPDGSTQRFYLFHPEAGHRYAFMVDLGLTDGIMVRFADANQKDLVPVQYGPWGTEVDVPPEPPGTYYFIVYGAANQTYSYRLVDVSSDTSDENVPTPLALEQPLTGTFESNVDVDSYVFTSDAELYVRPSCVAEDQVPCTASLTAIAGPIREVMPWTVDHDYYKVPPGSTVRVDVQRGEFGGPLPPIGYSVSMTLVSRDDFGDAPSDAAPLTEGVATHAVTDVFGDDDCFSFPAKAGDVYEVLSEAAVYIPSHANVSANEPFKSMVSETVAMCASSEIGIPFSITYVDLGPDNAGDTQATARFLDGAGTYDASFEFQDDLDWYAFLVVAGHDYLVRAPGSAGRVNLVAPNGETVRAGALDVGFRASGAGVASFSVGSVAIGPYQVVVSDSVDEAGDTSDAAAAITAPSTISGALGLPEDIDWYSFPVLAGHYYVARCTDFQPDAPGTSCDVYGSLVDGQTGGLGPGELDFHANVDGVGRIAITSDTHAGAQYQVALTEGIDDVGNTPDASVPLGDGGVSQGVLEYPHDVDVFSLDAGALELFSVQCPPGFVVSSGPFGGPCPTEVEQVSAGALYLRVIGPPDGGPYQLTVAPNGFDDYGNDPSTATPLAYVTPTSGVLELGGDQDVFSFPVTAGTSYTVHLTATERLSLAIIGPGGRSGLADGNWDLTPDQTGTVYFQVAQAGSWTPTPASYQISISSP